MFRVVVLNHHIVMFLNRSVYLTERCVSSVCLFFHSPIGIEILRRVSGSSSRVRGYERAAFATMSAIYARKQRGLGADQRVMTYVRPGTKMKIEMIT